MPDLDESEDRRELAKILSGADGDARHQALEQFVRARPAYGEGQLHLGLSFLLNRFSATLELPMSVIVLGAARSAPTHAPPDLVTEHLQKAEQHFTQAMDLDPGLEVPATTNLAAVRLAARAYDGAVAYVDELMQDGERSAEPALRQHLGIAHRELDEYERAIALFRSILDSGLSLVRRNLALTHLREDDLAGAEEAIREQVRVRDSELDRKLAGAIAAELRGDLDEARSAYLKIAAACEFDGANELLGVNARRRVARLVRRA